MMRQRNVLALIDGSEFSLLILHYIKQFLAPEAHRVILFCVREEPENLQPEQSTTSADFPAEFLQAREALVQEIVAELAPHQRGLEAAGFATAIAVRFGDPVREIDKFLDDNQVDLIAMTTHGHSGLRRVLLGSVAQHLIEHAALPILLYRPFGYE